MKATFSYIFLAVIIGLSLTGGILLVNHPAWASHIDTQIHQESIELDDFNGFKEYWYQGKAEITSYILEQARYGELHSGHAVTVFVTENFSKTKGTKTNSPSKKKGSDVVPILKLNIEKKFNTGIYPYSMMATISTPVDLKKHPHCLKVTTSSQEWCGHSFTQIDLRKQDYKVRLFSYFESEGETEQTVEKTLLEDELFTRIRLNPENLPTGKIQILPHTFYQRLKHTPFTIETAEASLEPHKDNQEWKTYTLRFTESDRLLQVYFTNNFPHKIMGWEESYKDGWGANAKKLVTKATLKKSILSDYWNHNSVSDASLRKELGLP